MSNTPSNTPASNFLVPVTPASRDATDAQAAGQASSRPNADFVAHLIATSSRAPQTCARRRAGPEAAIACYHALDRSPPLPGRALSRSL